MRVGYVLQWSFRIHRAGGTPVASFREVPWRIWEGIWFARSGIHRLLHVATT